MPDSKLKNLVSVLGHIWSGVKEDITYNKRSKGIGKWNDVIKAKKKKEKPAPTTPWTSFGKKNANDIRRAGYRNRTI